MGRRRELPGRQRQRGISLLLYATGALAVIGVAGLALDVGVAYVTRSKLQIAVDAAALAGAYSLSTVGADEAVTVATTTYTLNAAQLGTTAPTVELSPTLTPWVNTPAGLGAQYVKVIVEDLPSPALISSVLGFTQFTMDASAVAGIIPVGTLQNELPIALCGQPGADTDCSDGACYGLGPGEMAIVTNNQTLGPGNYGLLEIGCSGADCVRENMAGGSDVDVTVGGTVDTKPGGSSGPTSQGINTRFGQYQGPVSSTDYPPDVVTTNPLNYATYETLIATPALWNEPDGTPRRRVAAAPVVDCDPPVNGASTVSVLATVCLFLTRTVSSGNGTIFAELIPSCLVEGGGAPPGGGGAGGPGTIVLYQDI